MKATVLTAVSVVLAAAPAAAQQAINQTIPSAPTGVVEVSNLAGSVRVIGWDRPEVRITGTLGDGAERLAVEGGRDRTSIRVILPRNARNVRGSDLEIRVPGGKDVSVRTTSADIQTAGISGLTEARSVSGDVQIQAANTREVRANTTSGDVQVTGSVREAVAAESVSGDVQVSASTPDLLAKTVSGDLRLSDVTRRVTASTVSGDATIEARQLQHVSFESVSGALRLVGGLQRGASVAVESHSGDVEMALPAGVSADFQVSTFSGDITNELGPEARRTSRYSPGRELRFSTGEGGVVAIKTFSGNVELRRR